MSKAFNRVEWNYLEAVMIAMHVPLNLVTHLMRYVRSIKYKVLINGSLTPFFSPFRGIRQGDPLSPYLFIICAKRLSAIIKHAESQGLFLGLQFTNACLSISHLFFADNSLMFSKAIMRNAEAIKKVLEEYTALSGQEVNYQKSCLFFYQQVANQVQDSITHILGVPNKEG